MDAIPILALIFKLSSRGKTGIKDVSPKKKRSRSVEPDHQRSGTDHRNLIWEGGARL
jgi:hypothetical protein